MKDKKTARPAENLSVHAVGPGEVLRIETLGAVVELRTMDLTFGNKFGLSVFVRSRFWEAAQAVSAN